MPGLIHARKEVPVRKMAGLYSDLFDSPHLPREVEVVPRTDESQPNPLAKKIDRSPIHAR